MFGFGKKKEQLDNQLNQETENMAVESASVENNSQFSDSLDSRDSLESSNSGFVDSDYVEKNVGFNDGSDVGSNDGVVSSTKSELNNLSTNLSNVSEENLLNFPKDYMSIDTDHLLKQLNNLSEDIKIAYDLTREIDLFEPIEFENIIFVGMGGSSISGAIIRKHLESQGFSKPIFIVEDYHLPPVFSEKSLVFAISYSGNTEETVSAYREAIRKSNFVIALSTGGHLEEICSVNRKPFVKVPKGQQPRTAALSYLLFSILRIMERLNVIESQEEHVAHLRKSIQRTDFNKFAIGLSEKLMYSVPIIYASDKYYTAAYRFKCEINENAKVHAFANKYSEFNHNELCGYENLHAQYHIVTFRFDDDHRRIQKRMDIIKDLTKKAGVSTTEIKLSGNHYLTKLMSAILIGDYTAYYLALRYKTNPSPVDIIENMKDLLGPFI